ERINSKSSFVFFCGKELYCFGYKIIKPLRISVFCIFLYSPLPNPLSEKHCVLVILIFTEQKKWFLCDYFSDLLEQHYFWISLYRIIAKWNSYRGKKLNCFIK